MTPPHPSTAPRPEARGLTATGIGGVLLLLLLSAYVGGYLAIRHVRYQEWQAVRMRWDQPAITYFDLDWHFRFLFRPLMWVDERVSDVRYMHIPREEEK